MHVVETVLPNVSSYPRSGWAAFVVLLVLLIAAAFPSLQWMVVNEWFGSEEYSHAALIPLLAAYLVRQRADVFELPPRGHVVGVLILAFGCVTLLIGKLSAIHAVAQYGFLIGVFGAFGVVFGGDVLRRLVWPLLMLVFMVPLPNFLYQPLSSELQLISSELGVALIRAFGISVLLHGNVIDLGTYQLQVLEACNGLRYLFPLASLGYLFAYLYRGPLWQRVLLVAASTPITIALNSFRIAVIGVTVEHWGIAAADGVLHAFEGWLVFMACVGLLLCTAKILARINGYRGRLTGAFAIALGPAPAQFREAPVSAPWAVGAAILVLLPTIVMAQHPLHGDMTATATRRSFAEFPMDLGDGWRGRAEVLDARVLASLQLDDYVMADFANGVGGRVNFYSAFYGSQLAGRSAHSPRSCLPGDGWRITELSTIDVADPVTARQVQLNRAMITRGNDTQLVYYWFEQRGRVLANEYLVKWYILRDALDTQRTDGALVRLITPVSLGGIAAADATLRDFYVRTKTRLPQFIPG